MWFTGKQSLNGGRPEATDISRFWGWIVALVGNRGIQEFTCYLDATIAIQMYAEHMLSLPNFNFVTNYFQVYFIC